MKKFLASFMFLGTALVATAQDNTSATDQVVEDKKIGIKKIKHADQVLPRFFVDVNYKLGRVEHDFETFDLGSVYLNSIKQNNKFGNLTFSDGMSHGADLQIGMFIGRGRRFGIATGANYFIQTGNINLDVFHTEYESKDNVGRTFRQHLTAKGAIQEEFSFTNINIPLMLKFKHQFKNSKLGFGIDAGGFMNVYNSNKYRTNAAFDYEAIYKLNNDGSVNGFDNGVRPSVTSWMITREFFDNTHPKPDNTVEGFFANKQAEGYNVGLGQQVNSDKQKGSTSFNDMSYGALAQLNLSYYISYNVTFNVGGYYMYQMWSNKERTASDVMLTDKLGSYNSLMNSVKTSTSSSYGMNVGFRFFFGEKRDLDWDNIPDKQDRCVEHYGLLINKGCPDTDNDGIIDDEDECIDVAGTASANGCPDSDGDGIADAKDKCPDVPGEYQGCPEDVIAKKYMEEKNIVISEPSQPQRKVRYDVLTTDVLYFDFGKAILKDTATNFAALDKAVELLNKDQEVILFISGYTDAVGSYENNMKLSFNRADNVSKYVQSKGISKTRVIISGYGKDNPKSSNDTEEERAKNRRIEMKLLVPVEEASK